MQLLCLQIHLHRQRTRCFFPQSKFETETKKKCDQFLVAADRSDSPHLKRSFSITVGYFLWRVDGRRTSAWLMDEEEHWSPLDKAYVFMSSGLRWQGV